MRTFLLIIAGLIGGYGLILFGWIAYADLFGVGDRDGGKIMGVAFVLAPMGAIFCAITLPILFRRRRTSVD